MNIAFWRPRLNDILFCKIGVTKPKQNSAHVHTMPRPLSMVDSSISDVIHRSSSSLKFSSFKVNRSAIVHVSHD